MLNKLLFLITLSLANAQLYGFESKDLLVLNIDSIGENKILAIKNHTQVEWWVEMGDKMLIAPSQTDWSDLAEVVRVEKVLKNVDLDNLAFQILGHCDHSGLDEILHTQLDVVFSNNSSQIVDLRRFENKQQVFGHDSISTFKKNTVLSYQYTNRHHPSLNKNAQTQTLIDLVDANRWLTQVQFLSSLDRMLAADLIVAGVWLENKFNGLGLVTTRVSLHNNYRGFNLLGFKQGSSRADEWYVVGAHLDSRNRTWNDSQPSPGAEDNASGCSGVLEIANVISQYDTEASVVFMCFIEEESVLLGSKDVVTYLTQQGNIDKVKTMLNMDMISYRLNPNRNIAIAGTNTTAYQSLAETVAANGTLYTDIDWQINTTMCCTDFLSFANAAIPAVTSNQPDIGTYFGYHSVNDLPENVDPVLAAGIVKANLATLIDLVGVDFNSGDLIFAHGFE